MRLRRERPIVVLSLITGLCNRVSDLGKTKGFIGSYGMLRVEDEESL